MLGRSHLQKLAELRRRKMAAVRARAASVSPTGTPGGPPLTFREYVDTVRPGYQWYRHCVALADVLQRVADGELRRVMVFMPPRHGKSELVSRLFAGYYLYRHPGRWVGLNSYGAELAYTLSRATRGFYAKAGGKVVADASAVKHWETGLGGGLWAAGVGGPITGKGYHLGVIDDPLKNSEEASSEVIRAKQKEWYGSTFYTRAEPGDAIVVVQTRWHEDDLSGYLLDQEGDDNPERWHVVSMEAVKEEETAAWPDTCTVEPDPRAPGEPLCPERYPLEKLQKIRRTVGSYIFGALFQQRPTPAGGDMFTSFPVVDALPKNARLVRYWDKAGSQGKGDYTAGVLVAHTPGWTVDWVIADVVRGQWSASAREKVIKDTAAADGRHVRVYVEQEPGSGGKDSAEGTVKNLSGFTAEIDRVTGDKPSRAAALAAQAQVENVAILRGEWNREFLAEARAFPNGKHDDQVDAASGAFNKLNLTPRPGKTTAAPGDPTPKVARVGRAYIPGLPDAF